jgi:hypothetical protein
MTTNNKYTSFVISNYDVEKFLDIITKYSLEYNYPYDSNMIATQYIEVMTSDIPKAVAAMYEILGDEGQMELTYLDDDMSTETSFMLFISEENMANILREVLIIEVLGRAH